MSLDKILDRAVLASEALADRVTEGIGRIANQSVLANQFLGTKVPRNGELTIFGHYIWEQGTTDQDEIDHLLSGDWSPSTSDFMAVTGLSSKFSFKNFEAILSEIAQHKTGSIRRINLWAHGNSVSLGISGIVVPGNVIFHSLVDASSVRSLNDPGLEIEEKIRGKVVKFTRADIRKSFAPNAQIVIYSCNAAVEVDLLQAIADLLQVHVIGFSEAILYCPPIQNKPPFKRSGMKIGLELEPGGCEKNVTLDDWRMLNRHRSRVIANPR